MKEAVLVNHSWTSPPATNIRNKSNYPIYGIWCSLDLTVLRGNYSKNKEGIPSNRRVLWVEFQLTALFGSMNTIVKKVIQLKVSDSRDIKKISLVQISIKNNCVQKMKDLHSILINKFTFTQQQVYDKLLRFITVTRQKVKNNLRHVYRGEIE